MVERFSLLDGTRSELADVRDFHERAAKDFEPRRTCSVGESASVSAGLSRKCWGLEGVGVVLTSLSTQCRWASKLSGEVSLSMMGNESEVDTTRRIGNGGWVSMFRLGWHIVVMPSDVFVYR